MGLALLVASFVALPAGPASATVVDQCSSVDNTPGLGIQCDVIVANTLDLATGAARSTITVTECHGAANTAPSSCSGPTTTSFSELTTSVSQCNSVVSGGGASLHCSIHVVNTITGAATVTTATINQCDGSLGGGLVVLRACSPDGVTTTGATITQCNGTDNGGTSSLTCVVEPESNESAALRVVVNQCNSSANGGGSLVDCTVGMTTTVVPATLVTGPVAGGGTGGTEVGSDTGGGAGGSGGSAPGAVSPNATAAGPNSSGSLASTGTDSATAILPAGLGVLVGVALLLLGLRPRHPGTPS